MTEHSLEDCAAAVRKTGVRIVPNKFSASYLRRYNFQAKTIVDVGVCGGTDGLYRAFANRHFVLVEPLPEFETQVRKRYPALKADFFNCAAGAVDGEAEFLIHNKWNWFSGFYSRAGDQSGSTAVPVKVERLDKILSSKDYGRPFGVKIDVEGFELQVLEGLGTFAAEVEFFIIESHLRGVFAKRDRFSDLVVKMKSFGFELADILTATGFRPIHQDCLFLPKDDPRFLVSAEDSEVA